MLTFKEKGDDSGTESLAQSINARPQRHCSQVLKPNGFARLNFQTALENKLLLTVLFGTGMYITMVLCLSYHCILEANNVFSSFTGPETERM